jgi:hypothetical protein
MAVCFRRWPILEGTPNGKTRPCFCVLLYGPIFCFSSEWTTRDSSGAAGLFARRFPLLPKRTGRRCGGSTVLATAPAKTKFCLSKGIPEPRQVIGIGAGQDASLPARCCSRHCEEQSDEAIQYLLLRTLWIASLRSQLSYTAMTAADWQLASRKPSAPHC